VQLEPVDRALRAADVDALPDGRRAQARALDQVAAHQVVAAGAAQVQGLVADAGDRQVLPGLSVQVSALLGR
jgi:hypothetical protein